MKARSLQEKEDSWNWLRQQFMEKSDAYEDKKTVLNEKMLAQIREEKTKRLESDINADRIKIFLPQAWTLEYEIAGSGLYRLLATAIKAAQKK